MVMCGPGEGGALSCSQLGLSTGPGDGQSRERHRCSRSDCQESRTSHIERGLVLWPSGWAVSLYTSSISLSMSVRADDIRQQVEPTSVAWPQRAGSSLEIGGSVDDKVVLGGGFN